MKLLPKTEADKIIREQENEEKRRRKALSAETDKKISELNSLKEDLVREKDKISREMSEMSEKYTSLRHSLENEVVMLEKRKEEALKPISDKENAVILREEAVFLQEQALSRAEKLLEIEREKANDQVFELIATRDELAEIKIRNEAELAAISTSRERMIHGEKILNELWDRYYVASKQLDFDRDNWEATKEQEQRSIDVLKKEYAGAMSDIRSDRGKIDSERAALSAAFEEARLKGII